MNNNPHSHAAKGRNNQPLSGDLVQLVLNGDRFAEERFIHILRPIIEKAANRILRKCGRYGERRFYIEDMVHSVFLDLFKGGWRALRAYNPARGTIEAYYYHFAFCRCKDYMRSEASKRERQVGVESLERYPDTGSALTIERQSRILLQTAHEILNNIEYDLFNRVYILEQSSSEICQALSITPQAFYQRIHRIGLLLKAAIRRSE